MVVVIEHKHTRLKKTYSWAFGRATTRVWGDILKGRWYQRNSIIREWYRGRVSCQNCIQSGLVYNVVYNWDLRQLSTTVIQGRVEVEGNWAYRYLGAIWVWGKVVQKWWQNKMRRRVSGWEQLQLMNHMRGFQDYFIAKRQFGSVVSPYVVWHTLLMWWKHRNKMTEIWKEWTMLTCRSCREKN